MKNNDGKQKSRIKGWLKAPIRGLIKARDFYITAMINLAGRFSYVDGVYSCPTTQVTTLPRSFSLHSNTRDDDFSELVRVASIKCLEDRVDLDFQPVKASKIVPRSSGVVRIDEEHSFDVCDNKVLNLRTADLFPKSRSFVVVKGNKSQNLCASSALVIYISKMKAKDRNTRPKCMTPIRALSIVRDFYVQSMNNLANGVSNGDGPNKSLPRNFRINSSLSIRNNEEDFLELLRAASTEILRRHMVDDQHEIHRRQQPETTPEAEKAAPRSLRLTIGRIDEDRVCEFADDNLSIRASANKFVSKKQKLFLCPRLAAYHNK